MAKLKANIEKANQVLGGLDEVLSELRSLLKELDDFLFIKKVEDILRRDVT